MITVHAPRSGTVPRAMGARLAARPLAARILGRPSRVPRPAPRGCTQEDRMTKSEETGSGMAGEATLSQGDLAPGSVAGDYVVTELIARGGCGSVYRARNRVDGRVA